MHPINVCALVFCSLRSQFDFRKQEFLKNSTKLNRYVKREPPFLDTVRTLNVHKMFRRRPAQNVICKCKKSVQIAKGLVNLSENLPFCRKLGNLE